ncbi:MAG: hypothetical protein CMH22_16750 [Methylophaga sp.]|uniref:hypothetical protein n=1 Tax=Methylophaga sp. UBA678 TaxID=1946901 RepID=UPI000C3B235B|nr:hypothetical protein [Methylophaga sp. UBA678]MAX53626.1 hypothetical protein [Methylophaga sp.]|tara:strand:+ start:25589 stop:27004 length:1416 start_codon:yes stop_codon:yes gene_type:complete
MTASFTKTHWLFLLLAALLTVAQPSAEAGLISGLSKLGKSIDAPDSPHGSSFRFADELAHYPEGGVAEISFNPSQNQWLAKTPDGKSVPVHQFTETAADANKQATLLLSESHLPYSLDAFNKLPSDVAIKIKSRQGKTYSLTTSPTTKLIDKHISISISDISALKTAMWQLQRPISSSNMRLIQLADNPEVTLPKQNYGSKIPVDKVGTKQLLNALKTMRQQTFVISAKVENGFLMHGKEKIAVKDLEKVAADRDISLIILGSDKPKKTLQTLAKDWQKKKDDGSLNTYTTGDFYNAFAAKNSSAPIPVGIDSSGKLRTALHFDHRAPTKAAVEKQSSSLELASMPLNVLAKSAMLLQPNEARAKELDDRIHPLIPSWVHLSLIASLAIGLVSYKTSWFLYLKLWSSPVRVNYPTWHAFTIRYLLHRLGFVLLYLPLLGFISPIYILITWTYKIIHFLLIRPASWILSKFS